MARTPLEQAAPRDHVLVLHQWKANRNMYGADRIMLRVLKETVSVADPIVVVESDGEWTEAARSLGCEVIIRPMGVLRSRQMNPAGFCRITWRIVAASLWMARQIRRRNIRLVMTNTVSVMAGALAARMTARPHLWIIQDLLQGWAVALSVPVCSLSTRIVALSNASARSVHRGRTSAMQKTVVAYPGVDPAALDAADGRAIREAFSTPAQPVLVGLVGRLHYWKGQDYFLDALHHLKERKVGGYRALIVGGAYQDYQNFPEQLRLRSRELGLEDEVIFCGHRDDIQAVFRGLDIAVAPSTLPEPFGLVVAEAMAARLPVIATATGGPAEMIQDGQSGFLIPTGNPGLFSQRLERLIRDPQLRRDMGQRARQRVEAAFPAAAYEACIRREVSALLRSRTPGS